MYNEMGAGVGAGALASGTLATTGASIMWIVLAGFAMLAVGTALMRVVPKASRRSARS